MTDTTPATLFDPVNTPIEQIDLTDPLIMRRAIRALQDEVLYWRENAAAELATALHYAGEPEKLTTWLWDKSPARALRNHVSILAEALEGSVVDACFMCSGDIRPGDPVVHFSDEGDGHAICAGASQAEITAGRMAIPVDSLCVDDLSEEEAAEARKDPHATISLATRIFTPDQIKAFVDKGLAKLAALHVQDEAREAAIVTAFADSQDDVGGRYGLTTSTDKTSVSACKAWFSDIEDARTYAAPRSLTVWDLVQGRPVEAAEAA